MFESAIIRPRLSKGAITVIDGGMASKETTIIPFQFNPDQLTCSLEKRTVEKKGGAAKEDVTRTQGSPIETVKLTVQFDAADLLDNPDQNEVIAQKGLFPLLSTLEMLLYPTSEQLQKSISTGKKGKVQFSEWELPLTMLVWGEFRVVPILIKSFSVTEEAFDTWLNPIQAKVDLSLQVLTPMELKSGTKGYDTFMTYLQRKESLAVMYKGSDDNMQTVSGLIP